MTSEGTFQLIDPLAYHVNNVEDLDPKVVKAYKTKYSTAIAELTQDGDTPYDVFICINPGWHAFVLCVPCGLNDPFGVFSDIPIEDPFAVPDEIFCWLFELCFQDVELKLYKIRKEFSMFKDIKKRIKKSFHIGKFENVKPAAFEFAALRAAPHRYNVLLNDCVEFAKEFCVCMLSYCSNYRKLEQQVDEKIKMATATGLSIELLSRRQKSSAHVGNTFLGGMDLSTFFRGGLFFLL